MSSNYYLAVLLFAIPVTGQYLKRTTLRSTLHSRPKSKSVTALHAKFARRKTTWQSTTLTMTRTMIAQIRKTFLLFVCPATAVSMPTGQNKSNVATR